MEPENPVAAPKPAPVGPISLVLFASLMDTLGFGIMLPTLPFFARSLGAGPELIMICMAAFTAGLFVSTPVWGRLSDRFGRKPIICIGLAGTILCYVGLALATNIWTILLARLFGGVMAGNGAACTAYIVDVTSEEDRAKYIGLGGAIFGFGFIVGPVLGSLLVGDASDTARFLRPTLGAGALSLLSFLSILLFLPESHSRANRDKQAGIRATEQESKTLVARIRELSPALFTLSACAVLYSLSSGFYETIIPLWAADFGLISGPEAMWMLILPGGIGLVFAQAVLIGPLNRRFGERKLILMSAIPLSGLTILMTVAGSASNLAFAMVTSGIMAIFVAFVLASSHILASKLADESNRGEVLGLFSSVSTFFRTIGMVASGALYSQVHPHAPYWSAAVATFFIFFIARRLPA